LSIKLITTIKMFFRKKTPAKKDNLDLVFDLGYSIDDGQILLETPNSHPLPIGYYRGNLPPVIRFDRSCPTQFAAAARFLVRWELEGRTYEIESHTSRGKLSSEIGRTNEWLAALRRQPLLIYTRV
jgi:hypothetical protein